MSFIEINSILQDWRNLENVNQNNMQILNTTIGNLITGFYPLQASVISASIDFTPNNKFGLTASTSSTATFNWDSNTNIIIRFPDQPINTYPGCEGFTDTIQTIIVTISNPTNVINLTAGSGNNYVVATLSIIANDAYRATASVTLSSGTEPVPTGNDKVALFKLVDDGTGNLTTEVDNNCIYNYLNIYATPVETQAVTIDNKSLSPQSLQGIFKNILGNSIDLNTITSSGWYFQELDSQAASGSNYPAPYAGMLIVQGNSNTSGSTVDLVYQLYTINKSSTIPSQIYHRMFDSTTGTWGAWKKIIDQNGGMVFGAGGVLGVVTTDGTEQIKFTVNNLDNGCSIDFGGNTADISLFKPAFPTQKYLKIENSDAIERRTDNDAIALISDIGAISPRAISREHHDVTEGDWIALLTLREDGNYNVSLSGSVVVATTDPGGVSFSFNIQLSWFGLNKSESSGSVLHGPVAAYDLGASLGIGSGSAVIAQNSTVINALGVCSVAGSYGCNVSINFVASPA